MTDLEWHAKLGTLLGELMRHAQTRPAALRTLTPEEVDAGLKAHGLAFDKPSQLADAFRHGCAWAPMAVSAASLARDSQEGQG